MPLYQRLKRLMIGDARNISDPHIFHKLSLIAFFAWVGLGSDGLTSSCYGPEEAFLALGHHTSLAVFVAIGTVITIFIVAASYSQIIELFPSGGGGYLVASKLLSPSVGMVSGCALLIDYVLTITLSIASGADALFSFFPAAWLPFKMLVAVTGVLLLTWLNMRGVKESVLPLVPIFLIFLVTHAFAIIYAFVAHSPEIPAIVSSTAADVHRTTAEIGGFGMVLLVLRAYSMGAGTFTGIEAVSNGIPILRDPKVKTAKHTMRYMSFSLAFMVFGLIVAYLLYHVHHVPGRTLNAVLFYDMTRNWNATGGATFVVITLLSEALLLFVAAQTGFLDGPRILSNMALDRWAPSRFAALNDRLVTQNGVIIMGAASLILMLYSAGSVRFLVVLYSINVFVTFSLSQLGMVRHWWIARDEEEKWKHRMIINAVGLVLTTFILVMVVVLKFHEGGWLTLFITGTLVAVAVVIKRHYSRTGRQLRRLNSLVELEHMESVDSMGAHSKKKEAPEFDPKGETAVLFVNGFSGMGLHSLFSIIRLFKGSFKNFVFLQVGLVDSGVFKGAGEIEELKSHTKREIDRYIAFMARHGYYAEGETSIAVDIVEESVVMARQVLERHPGAIFFAGQLVFHEDTFLTRLLHNYSAFALQRRFYHLGIPIIILPIRV